MMMIEGVWTGYYSHQRRVCHRAFVGNKYGRKVMALGRAITFSDGTDLILYVTQNVRPSKSRPRIDGYSQLIRECVEWNCTSVRSLSEKQNAAKELREGK